MPTKKTESGIRAYLDGLSTSTRPVVDREAVRELRSQLRSESDSINKLRLLAELAVEEAGRVPDLSAHRAVFVAEAKAWAEAEGIPVGAFQALGVPDDVLKDAGFDGLPAGKVTVTPKKRGRAPSLDLDEVLAVAKGLPTQWKLNELSKQLNRDSATTRNYVKKLVEQGSVTEIGDDPAHDGRGRAAKLYRVGAKG